MTNEELVCEVKAGRNVRQNMQQLYLQNKGLIKKYIRPFMERAEAEDLMQQAYFGIDAAVKHYDVSQGVKFASYFPFWVRQVLHQYQADTAAVRVPANVWNDRFKCRRYIRQYEADHGGTPSDAEICRDLNWTVDHLEEIKRVSKALTPRSLDKPIAGADGDDAVSMLDVIPDGRDYYGACVDRITRQELAASNGPVWKAVDDLPARQREVILKHYREDKTLAVIGADLGMTGSRAQQIEAQALEALRHHMQLQDFAEEYKAGTRKSHDVKRQKEDEEESAIDHATLVRKELERLQSELQVCTSPYLNNKLQEIIDKYKRAFKYELEY